MISKQRQQTTAIALALLVLASGCHPTQPFYFHNDGDLSHYLDTATDIEYPDVEVEPLAEASHAAEPLHLRNLEFAEYVDLSLEEAIAIALHNSEVIRSVAQFQQFGFASTGASRVAGAATIYDPALSETLTTPTPLQVDGNGNRVLSRGATRANAVGGYADALAEFDAQLFSTASWSTTHRPQNVGRDAAGNENPFNPLVRHAKDGNFLVALSKRTATGGVFTARHTIGYSRNNTAIGIGRAVPSDWTAALELEVNHPLLRGAGAQVNRIPVVLARIRTDISLATFEAAVRNLVLDVERTYWDLHCAYRIVEANKQGRDAALAAWQKDRVRATKKDPGAQEPRSAGQYMRFRARYEASLADSSQGDGLFILERRLRGLMGLSPTDKRLIRPVDEPAAAFVEFDWKEVLLESLIRAPEIRQQKWQLKQTEMELISARNQLLPDVNLGMRYRIVGVGDELTGVPRRGFDFQTTPVGSRAYDNLTQGDFGEALFTLTYQPNSIGSRRENARIQNAVLEVKKSKAVLREIENNVSHELSNAVAGVNNAYQLAQIAYSGWVEASREVRNLLVRRDVDERIHDQLLDAFDRRATARIDYYQRLCDYNKAVASVHFVKGSLLEYNGIQLAEGPWPKKAYWDALGRARERDASYYFDYGSTRPGVVSRGPAPQGHAAHAAGGEMIDGQWIEGEAIEGEAIEGEAFEGEAFEGEAFEGEAFEGGMRDEGLSPPQPAPEELPAPTPAPQADSIPEARRPSLNAPLRAGAEGSDQVRPAAFSWGDLGGLGSGQDN